MPMAFWDAVKHRRSLYGFTGREIVPAERIKEILRDALLHVPSAFNSQSTRLVLLMGEHHRALWALTLDALKAVTDQEQFAKTTRKINRDFAAGYGTVLFFEDMDVVDGLVAKFPLYAQKFPAYSQHTNAMHQYVVWSALEAEGLGCSLQHYNPLIDDALKAHWDLPARWQLIAQMPFGEPANERGPKAFGDLAPRLRVFI